jgi:predicted nucleic acid-binding protein
VRAVLDPNVLISAPITPAGPPAALVAGWLSGRFELVVSEAVLGELPDDDCPLALAEESRAILVSGDRLLVGLGDRFPVRTPRELLDAPDTAGA